MHWKKMADDWIEANTRWGNLDTRGLPELLKKVYMKGRTEALAEAAHNTQVVEGDDGEHG